jgi:ABC-type lipoprotein release transport system permease subunit
MNNKKIIFRVTRTYMMQNRKRTLITFLGILIMVILMTAVFIGKDTVMNYMKNAVIAEKGSWHYQVYDIDIEQAEQIKALRFIDKFEVSKPLGYTEFPESGNPEVTPFLEIKEYSEELFELMNIKVKEGRYPENHNEVIISETALKEGADIKIGDTVKADCFDRYIHAYTVEEQNALIAEGKKTNSILLPIGFVLKPGDTLKVPDHFPYNENNALIEMIHKPNGISRDLTIVGIMEEPFYGTPGEGGYIALTGTDNTVGSDDKINAVLTIDLKTKEDCYGEIAKVLDSSKTPEERETAINKGSKYITQDGEVISHDKGSIVSNDMILAFTANGQNDSFNFLILFCQTFFVVLITAASLVLIYNVFSMSYRERCRYLGMLSSVGATRKQKRWSVYYEVFFLLSLALPFGIGIGILVVKAGMALLYPHFSKLFGAILMNVVMGRNSEITYKLVIDPVNILFVVIFSTAAVWISAWIPAFKISKIGPVESIRGNETSMKLKKKGYKSYLGLMLKGKAEKLIGTASVERNLSSTKGIIRSITAFTALTLITAFAAGSIADILKSMENEEDMILGSKYTDCSYAFRTSGHLDEDWYLSGRENIMNSDEVGNY